MLRTSLLFVALGASLALVGCEEDPTEPEFGLGADSFAEFDLNNDLLLSPAEFEMGFVGEGVFETFDTDLSGALEEDEFDSDLGAFNDFDLNGDLGLDEGEFIDGTFGVFDSDLDAFVDETEFAVGLDLF